MVVTIGEAKVEVGPLLYGEGIDLVVRGRTVQLSCEEADELAEAITKAAKKSKGLTL
jgi:hypothetical protein